MSVILPAIVPALLMVLLGFALAFVLQCAMPVAVYNYLFAQMYNSDPEDVASLVIVSTALSVVTTPIFLAILVK